MTWWPCFVCNSDELCAHREPEIVLWMREQDWVALALGQQAILARRPAARETGAQGELFLEGAA